MNLSRTLSTFLFILILSGSAVAQESEKEYDALYGLNPELYNGEIYKYFLAPDTKGNQYLNGPEFTEGSLQIKGNRYAPLQLNYDVFNEQILLKYDSKLGSSNIIAVSKAWLDGFSLGSSNFELHRINDTLQQIFQVVGQGKVRLLARWTKEQKIGYYYTAPYYFFFPAQKELFIDFGFGLKKIRNNKSFITLFNLGNQTIVKKYLHQNKIDIRKAADSSLQELINFCNTIQL